MVIQELLFMIYLKIVNRLPKFTLDYSKRLLYKILVTVNNLGKLKKTYANSNILNNKYSVIKYKFMK